MDNNISNRVVKALIAVVTAMTIGTAGFWFIGEGAYSFGDCLYMTIITLSTVGYGEVIPLGSAGRMFTSVLILFGMGSIIYFGSTIIAVWVEIDLQQSRKRKKMQKAIDNLKDHVIICGVGTTGAHVVRELLDTKTPFVVIDISLERIQEVRQSLEGMVGADRFLFVHGDSTEDRQLELAGIKRAAGLVAALRNDKDNLYLVLSARQFNPGLRLVARATEEEAPKKMIRAGADRVVSPNLIGGMRIASEVVRPQVVEFLDQMLRDKDQNIRIEQVELRRGSPLVNKKLSETKIRKSTDVLVIAIRDRDGGYTYNPGPEAVLQEESTLIVLGNTDSVIQLRNSLSAGTGAVPLIDR